MPHVVVEDSIYVYEAGGELCLEEEKEIYSVDCFLVTAGLSHSHLSKSVS